MKEDIFKDLELIKRIDFKTVIIKNIRKKLLDNGWIIEEEKTKDGVTVRLYESEHIRQTDTYLYEETGLTSDKALKNCLKEIQDYYIKVEKL